MTCRVVLWFRLVVICVVACWVCDLFWFVRVGGAFFTWVVCGLRIR